MTHVFVVVLVLCILSVNYSLVLVLTGSQIEKKTRFNHYLQIKRNLATVRSVFKITSRVQLIGAKPVGLRM